MQKNQFIFTKIQAVSKHIVVSLFYVGFFMVLLSIFGCKSNIFNKNFDEGIIEYSIIYDESQSFKYDPMLRPNKMVVKFKDSNTVNKIEGLSGGFMLALVQNYQQNMNYTLINIFGKKLFYSESMEGKAYPYAYSGMQSLTIKKTEDKVEFMGLNCLKAIAIINDSIPQSFEILYTNELAINNPNRNTPFQEIDGVMLKFSVVLMNQNMQIVANSIKSMDISMDEFILPKDYEQVDEQTLNDIFELLQ
jgi:hypothetical protein